MQAKSLTATINETDSVSMLLYPAAAKTRIGVTLILGHGAGANQLSPFMRLFASGLAERGIDALTFNFLYMEQGRKVPDRGPKLESCYRVVIETIAAHKDLKGNKIFIGGKSMGGRIASQVAAESGAQPDKLLPIAGLVFLGYPLHPPGKPDQLRDKHLPDIKVPMLFIQGSRDAFGTADEIQKVIKKLKLNATLYRIEGGDHSLKVPKNVGLTQPEVFECALDEIDRCLRLM